MKERLFYFDVIKIFAIVCVLACHASLIYNGESVMTTSAINYANITIGHLGVPLFLMVTGSLLFQKKFDSIQSVKRFYLHNLLPIILIGELWCLVYFLINDELKHDLWGG